MISLEGLNPPQRHAAETIDGPVLILAGAGSGKTRTITYRIAHMVANLRIPPEIILGVSFTNKAAKEMKERVHALLKGGMAKGINLSTFHSLGVNILKAEIDKLGYNKNFSIYDTSDQKSIIREALKHYKCDKKFDLKLVQSKIGFLKNKGIDEIEFANSPFFDPENAYDHVTEYCYRFYQEKLHFFNAIDFDDILFLTVKLFAKYPEIAQKYSQKFKYIMIDEYQDTNPLQFDIVLALTSTHNNLCVVGDDDQSIYAFRGADISNILGFEAKFKGAKVIKLEQNYRSTSNILELANKVIKENKNRKDKTLWSAKKSEIAPLLWATADTDHESQIVTEEIINYQSKGNNLDDLAVLYRSKTQAPPIEDQLRMNGIPYTIIGGQKFYDKKEIKDLMAYLVLIQNISDEISLRRIINVPNRGIGTKTLMKYVELSKQSNQSLFRAFENNPEVDPNRANFVRKFTGLVRKYQGIFKSKSLSSGISDLIEDINFLDFIEKQHSDNPKQAEVRKNDVMAFIESAARFERYAKSKANLKTFIEELLLKDSQDNQDEDEEEKTNQVSLMTLHSSKGLEFKQVFLVGMEEGILPHKKTLEQGEDIGEERRLCYVGITRAQEKLIMTYCKERDMYGKKVPRHRSRFINNLDKENFFVEQDRTTFGHLSEEEAVEYKKNFFGSLIDSLDD